MRTLLMSLTSSGLRNSLGCSVALIIPLSIPYNPYTKPHKPHQIGLLTKSSEHPSTVLGRILLIAAVNLSGKPRGHGSYTRSSGGAIT